jgi:hypothetical protein
MTDKSVYHMTMDMGPFDGKKFFKNNKSFDEGDVVYVISSSDSKSGLIPFLEGKFKVKSAVKGSFTYSDKSFNHCFDLLPIIFPREPIDLSNIQARLGKSKFSGRHMSQGSTKLKLSEKLEFDEILQGQVSTREVIGDHSAVLLTDIENIIQSDTEKESAILARIGQGKFRRNVSKVWGLDNEVCLVTGLALPAVLTASHIVPWKDCVGEHAAWRLDGANGILLTANLDKLFDRHLISFVQKGFSCVIQISDSISKDYRHQPGLTLDLELVPNKMVEENKKRFYMFIEIHHKTFLDKELLKR